MKEQKVLNDSREAIWLPPELKEGLEKTARVENYRAVWRFIDMLYKNYRILKNTTHEKK